MILKGESLSPCHFFHHESHMTGPRLNAGLYREANGYLSHGMAQQHLDHLNEIKKINFLPHGKQNVSPFHTSIVIVV